MTINMMLVTYMTRPPPCLLLSSLTDWYLGTRISESWMSVAGLYNTNYIWVIQFYLQQEFFKLTSHIKVNNFQYNNIIIVVHLSQLPSELMVSLSVYSNDSKNISTIIMCTIILLFLIVKELLQ